MIEPYLLAAMFAVPAPVHFATEDVAELIQRAADARARGDLDAADAAYEEVLALDPENGAAHVGLRHVRFDDRWFESHLAMAVYRRRRVAEQAEQGLVWRHDEWVPSVDVPFLEMGWVKGDDGAWVDPLDVARRRQAAEWQAAGHQFRADDSSWVAPENFDHWSNGLFLCGDQWLDLEAADAYHSNIDRSWVLTGEHFEVRTTCDWQTGNAARWHADQVFPHLVRLFGRAPATRPRFVVHRSLRDYNDLSTVRPLFQEYEGTSSLHGGYFAEMAFDDSAEPPRFAGCGVSYWDVDTAEAAWGPFWARWAAAQSFVEAIDPSWNTVGSWLGASADVDGDFALPFWEEKAIPRWLRYGAASYVERYLPDPTAGAGQDPSRLRAFAIGELKNSGGLRPLDELFAFEMSGENETRTEMYHEAGLVIAFLLDGAAADEELGAVHARFRDAVAAGDSQRIREAATELEGALAARRGAIEEFATL